MEKSKAIKIVRDECLPNAEGQLREALVTLIPALKDEDERIYESLLLLVNHYACEENREKYIEYLKKRRPGGLQETLNGYKISDIKTDAIIEGQMNVITHPETYGLVRIENMTEKMENIKNGLLDLKETMQKYKDDFKETVQRYKDC